MNIRFKSIVMACMAVSILSLPASAEESREKTILTINLNYKVIDASSGKEVAYTFGAQEEPLCTALLGEALYARFKAAGGWCSIETRPGVVAVSMNMKGSSDKMTPDILKELYAISPSATFLEDAYRKGYVTMGDPVGYFLIPKSSGGSS